MAYTKGLMGGINWDNSGKDYGFAPTFATNMGWQNPASDPSQWLSGSMAANYNAGQGNANDTQSALNFLGNKGYGVKTGGQGSMYYNGLFDPSGNLVDAMGNDTAAQARGDFRGMMTHAVLPALGGMYANGGFAAGADSSLAPLASDFAGGVPQGFSLTPASGAMDAVGSIAGPTAAELAGSAGLTQAGMNATMPSLGGSLSSIAAPTLAEVAGGTGLTQAGMNATAPSVSGFGLGDALSKAGTNLLNKAVDNPLAALATGVGIAKTIQTPSTPAAPDFTSAAEKTAAAGRVNQYTPYGSSVYGYGGTDAQGNPIWNQTTSLSPVGQQLFDAQNQTSLGLAGLQNSGLDYVKGTFNNLPSASQLPASVANPGQTLQDAIYGRMAPTLNRQRDQLRTQLKAQGLREGTDAWNNAMYDQGQRENDALLGATQMGVQETNAARQQGMNEQGFYTQLPVNLLNSIRSGSQVQYPTFGATAPGANYNLAAQNQYQGNINQYNAQTGNYNSWLNGLFGLGSAYLMKPGG